MAFHPILRRLLAATALSTLAAAGARAEHWAEAPPAQHGRSPERRDRLTEVMQG